MERTLFLRDQALEEERENTERERQQKEYFHKKCDELMAMISEQARIASFIASAPASSVTPPDPPALPSAIPAATPPLNTRRRSPKRKRKPPIRRGS